MMLTAKTLIAGLTLVIAAAGFHSIAPSDHYVVVDAGASDALASE